MAREIDTPKIYASTMDYHYRMCKDGDFYPEGTEGKNKLAYYASVFNALTIKSTFWSNPTKAAYEKLIESVPKDFRFIIAAPKRLTFSKTLREIKCVWDCFWEADQGGCKILHTHNLLGCISLEFPSYFNYADKHLKRLEYLAKILPKGVRFAFEFRHISWWEKKQDMIDLFKTRPEWCITVPYVENEVVATGWAGTIKSTRVYAKVRSHPIITTSDFILINFHGTMGPQLGSYDDNGFLERISTKIAQLDVSTVFCSFNNIDSTYCFPLPVSSVMGMPMQPQMKKLPEGITKDLPCSLHDALKFKELVKKHNVCPYQVDNLGYIEMDIRL